MLAGVINGQLYVSNNGGITWTARDSNRYWSGVTMSADGSIMAAIVQDGQIYTSSDEGVTWTARDSSRYWTGIDSTADGTTLYAVAGANLYRSTNSGVTWALRKAGAFAVRHVACAADGQYVYMAGSPGYLFWSGDAGPCTEPGVYQPG